MGFIISCVVYIAVCEGICRMLGLENFNKKAWVYAIVSVFGGAILKSMMA
jgi:hypothetical protein